MVVLARPGGRSKLPKWGVTEKKMEATGLYRDCLGVIYIGVIYG